jgi:hypothetical protein
MDGQDVINLAMTHPIINEFKQMQQPTFWLRDASAGG